MDVGSGQLFVDNSSGFVGIGSVSLAADAILTVRQQADSQGIKIFGYDDGDTRYGHMYMDSNNDFYIRTDTTSTHIIFSAGGSNTLMMDGDGDFQVGQSSYMARLINSQSGGTPVFSFSSDEDTGIGQMGPAVADFDADTLSLRGGGIALMQLGEYGNLPFVGIGTAATTSYTFAVDGTASISDDFYVGDNLLTLDVSEASVSSTGKWKLTTTETTGEGFYIDASSVTTGNGLLIEVDGTAMTSGKALQITRDGASMFNIGEWGDIYAAGQFSGSYLTMTSTTASYFTGPLGIGTTTPSTELSIVGTASISEDLWASGAFQFGGGELEATQSYSRLGGNDTGHGLDNAYDLLISGMLEVDGMTYFDGGTTFGSTASVTSDFSVGDSLFYVNVGTQSYQFGGTGTASFAGDIDMEGDLNVGNNDLYIDSSTGYVGIGTGASMSAKFNVAGTSTDNAYFFYNNADVGDTTNGQSLYVYRRAAEGDEYLRMYVDDSAEAIIETSMANLKFNTGGATIENWGPVNIGTNWYGSGVNYFITQYGYITAASTQKYIQWQVSDTTDTFNLTRQDDYIVGFNIGMPTSISDNLDVDGIVSISDGLYVDTFTSISDDLSVASSGYTIGDDYGPTLYIDTVNDYVGIGTTAPTTKLYIRGTDPEITLYESATGAIMSIQQGQAFGIVGPESASDLSLQTGGGSKIYIQHSGSYVGIGTYYPSVELSILGTASISQDLWASGAFQFGGGEITATASYSRLGLNNTGHGLDNAYDLLISGMLEVDGMTYFDGGTTFGSTASITGDFSVGDSLFYVNVGTQSYQFGGTGTASFVGPVNISQDLNVSEGDLFVDDSTGYVGIGTTNPLKKLSVSGNISGTQFDDYEDSSYYINPSAGDVSILVAGNVGIGTKSPDSLLDVAGQIIASSSYFTGLTQLTHASVSDDLELMGVASISASSVLFRPETNSTTFLQMASAAFVAGDDYPIFNVDTQNGRVGIGTAAPDSKLTISGSGYS